MKTETKNELYTLIMKDECFNFRHLTRRNAKIIDFDNVESLIKYIKDNNISINLRINIVHNMRIMTIPEMENLIRL